MQPPHGQQPRNPYAAPTHAPGQHPPGLQAGHQGGPSQWWPNYDATEVRQRIKSFNSRSLMLGVPGLLLQGVGNLMKSGSGALLSLLGTVMLIAGLTYYVKSRGRHWAFGLLGLLSCLGLFILAVLPRKCLVCGESCKSAQCQQCGAPAAA